MNNLAWLLPLAFFAWLLLRARGASSKSLKALKARQPQRVDVRTPVEFAGGHAPGSINIPLDRLMERLGELDPARPVVLACASGSRSAVATSLLKRQGFDSVNAGRWSRLMELS